MANTCETNKYHDLNCCEWTRGVDTLLSRYKQDREQITSLMSKDPNKLINTIWKHDGPLAIDNECRCKMGEGEKRSQFACAQCKNMRRIIDLRKSGIDVPFQIECGNMAGKTFILRQKEVPVPFLKWDTEAAARAKVYVQQYQELLKCGTPNVKKLQCVTGDAFTIRTLVQWMIQKIFSERGLDHSLTLHTAFICHNKGFSLYNMPSIGGIREVVKRDKYKDGTVLQVKTCKSIILQVLVMLTELSTINFSHGNVSVDALIFTDDPVSYKYKGLVVSGPITAQISDLWNASLTVNNVHYFPQNVKSTIFLENRLFAPEIVTLNKDDGLVYRLTNSTMDIYTAMRHIGFPLYVGSFDFYCFMVTLMSVPEFYGAVVKNTELYRLWSKMWLTDDFANVEKLVKEGVCAVEVIKGAWLRCDVINFMWELLKE